MKQRGYNPGRAPCGSPRTAPPFIWTYSMRYPVLCSAQNFPAQDPHAMAIIAIDRTAKQIVLAVQEYSLFAWQALLNLFRPPIYWTDFLIQSDIIGVGSLPIVILSGF